MKHRLTICVLVSVATIVSCVHVWSAIAGRWNEVIPGMATIATYVVAAVVLSTVVFGTASTKHRRTYLWLLLVLGSLFVGTALISKNYAASLRSSEIAISIDKGLADDCETVLLAYRDDPEFKSDGYVRIFPGSQKFDSLPDSILAFDPVYVTIEENSFGTNQPLSIGLCKNGFGGFNMGIRVFQTAPDIPASLNRKPITPTIYLCVDET